MFIDTKKHKTIKNFLFISGRSVYGETLEWLVYHTYDEKIPSYDLLGTMPKEYGDADSMIYQKALNLLPQD